MAKKETNEKPKEQKKPAVKKSTAKKTAPKKAADKKKSTIKRAVKKETYVPNLKKQYKESIVPALKKRFGYRNVMEVPHISVISINMGIGDAKTNPKALENAVEELSLITGQKAVVTRSRKDISNFKIRKGFPVGCKVTIRGNRMYEFLERLISIALPRTRDFNGLSFKSFDRKGNYSFGVIEQIVFTEIDYDKIDAIRGMDVTIATSANSDDEAYWLLKEFGFPLREKPVKQEEVAEAA
jgi:large subunit ribosomal protein L5|tara:strand:- start:9574 stop:10293 length:720 start_codon:yes stop_codon:yes gene_type:complete